MNDRYGFRVWDKTQNRWLHFDFSTYPTYQDRIWQALTDGETFYQCTGLKDKNGELIYEGDILRLKDIKIPVEVRFRGIGFELYAEPSNMAGYHNDKYIPENSEVIGNIYENKELLDER